MFSANVSRLLQGRIGDVRSWRCGVLIALISALLMSTAICAGDRGNPAYVFYKPSDRSILLQLNPAGTLSFPLRSPRGEPGLRGEYFDNRELEGDPVLTRVDHPLNFRWGPRAPAEALSPEHFSVRWTGKIGPAPRDGKFKLSVVSDDGIRVWIDGEKVVEDWTRHSAKTDTVELDLTKGETRSIRMEYFEATGYATCQLGLSLPEEKAESIASAAVTVRSAEGEKVGTHRVQWKEKPIRKQVPVGEVSPGVYTAEILFEGTELPVERRFEVARNVPDPVFELDEESLEAGHKPVWAIQLDGKPYNTMTDEVVTSHIPWMRPAAQGKVDGLFIVPRQTGREVIELKQRFSINPSVAVVDKANSLGAGSKFSRMMTGTSPEERANALRNAVAKSYDVIVLGLVEWEILPKDVKKRIKTSVQEGTGLVVVYPRWEENAQPEMQQDKATKAGRNFITSGVPFGSLEDASSDRVKTGSFGEGRVAILDYNGGGGGYYGGMSLTPTVGLAPDDMVNYEYYQAVLIKSVMWASKGMSRVRVEAMKAPDETVKAGVGNTGAVTAVIRNTSERKMKTQANWYVRQKVEPFHTVKSQFTLSPGKNKVSIPLPRVTAGTYFVDLVLENAGKKLAWGTASVEYEVPVKIAAIELDKEGYQPGSSARVRVRFEDLSSSSADLARVRLKDGNDRILYENTKSVSEKTDWQLPLNRQPSFKRLVEVAVLRENNEKPLAVERRPLYVTSRDKDRFHLVLWKNIDKSYLGEHFFRRALKAGINTVDAGGMKSGRSAERLKEMAGYYAGYDCKVIPYITRIADRNSRWSTKSFRKRKPCLTGPDYRKNLNKSLESAAGAISFAKPPAYSLGDENWLTNTREDVCFSSTCREGFRKWMKQKTQNLKQLNKNWGTSYDAWEEVSGITLEKAREKGRLAQWIDFRRYMDHVFVDTHRKACAAIHDGDPDAKVGFDGAIGFDSYRGYDWEKFGEFFGLAGCYPWQPQLMALQRSFCDPEAIRNVWIGGYTCVQRAGGANINRTLPWRIALQGSRSIWLFAESRNHESIISPDLSYAPPLKHMLPDLKQLSEGIGRQINVAERVPPKVAIFWSKPAMHAGTFLDMGVTVPEARLAWQAMIKMTGREIRYVGPKGVKNGELDSCEALVMPLVSTLSDEVAEEIENFVNGGGVLLADVPPGRYDDRGRPRKSGRLDKLFGVTSGSESYELRQREITLSEDRDGESKVSPREMYSCSGIRVTGGTSLSGASGAPAQIMNTHGEGVTCLMGAVPPLVTKWGRYRWDDGLNRVKDAYLWADSFLGSLGIAPRRNLSCQGEAYMPVHTFNHALRKGRLLGILRPVQFPDTGPHEVSVELPEKRHVYEVRTGEYLGYTETPEMSVMTGKPALLSSLPYEVKTITGDTQDRVASGEACSVEFNITTVDEASVADHVFRITLENPAGEKCEWFARNVTSKAGKVTIPWQVALNVEPGIWTVKARDILTGTTGEAEIRVTGE